MDRLTLDRDQRAALRRELEFVLDQFGGVGHTSADVRYAARELQMACDALDEIGWTDETDVPDAAIKIKPVLAEWARATAKGLAQALGQDLEPVDQELDDLAVLSAIGGDA